MEDFWQSVKDILILLIKVTAVLLVIDIGCKIGDVQFRVPLIANFVDTMQFLIFKTRP